ncbi:MAG: hypothetical protein GXP50_01880 [Deltaproteobacteria bacterium]|nr:hypothetical protein [Deltaproteobacteria bacterium]
MLGRWVWLAAVLLAVWGCAGAAFAPLTRVDAKVEGFTKHYAESFFQIGENRVFSVELETSPARLRVGKNRFELIVHHAKMGDVEGARVEAVATGPSGQEVHPRIWEVEYGAYDVTGLAFDEPGAWTLDVRVWKGNLQDRVRFDLVVPPPRG